MAVPLAGKGHYGTARGHFGAKQDEKWVKICKTIQTNDFICIFVAMKQLVLPVVVLLSLAVEAAEPWKWRMENKEEEAVMRIDLYEETVDVPGMELFGPMNGYLGGKGIYGLWMVTSFKIKNDQTAELRLSNDQGSETQAVRLTWQTDSTCLMELQGGVAVKRVVNNKLVKIPQRIVFKRK